MKRFLSWRDLSQEAAAGLQGPDVLHTGTGVWIASPRPSPAVEAGDVSARRLRHFSSSGLCASNCSPRPISSELRDRLLLAHPFFHLTTVWAISHSYDFKTLTDGIKLVAPLILLALLPAPYFSPGAFRNPAVGR